MPINTEAIRAAVLRSLAMKRELNRTRAAAEQHSAAKAQAATDHKSRWLTEKARLAAAASDKQAAKLAALKALDEQKEHDRQAHAADCVRRFIEINS